MKAVGLLYVVSLWCAAAKQENLVQLAESNTDLSTLVSALVAAGLTDSLSSCSKRFTVFAPTNEAFNALPAGTLDNLMKPENKQQLVDILLRHIIPNEISSTEFRLQSTPHRVRGYLTEAGSYDVVGVDCENINVSTSAAGPFRRITSADNKAVNGVIHIIDGVLLPAAPPTPTPPPQPKQKNLVELCESNKDLSILTAALVAAGLTDTLSSHTEMFTVFAPTDEAFKALPAGTLDRLMKPENKKELVDILTYHVLPEKVLSSDLKPFQAVTTVEGKPLHVTKWGGLVRVGPSLRSEDLKNVTNADNLASNGVAHTINGVLLPPRAQMFAPTFSATPLPSKQKNLVELCESNKDLSILTAALVAAGLADTLSSLSEKFTVFAPTDEAFHALPAGTLDHLMKPENKKELVDILTYHVLPEQVLSTDLKPFQAVTTVEGKPLHVTKWGGSVRVGPSLRSEDLKNVINADNLASNGVAHIINGVLLPPRAQMVAPAFPAAPLQSKQKNLVELCESNKDLSILTAALVAAGLADTLSSLSEKFTVFAPTDEAFNALPAGTLDHLMKPENKKELVDILTYHVLPEQVLSTDLKPFQAVTTVEGKPLHVTKWGGLVRVGPSLRSADLRNVTHADNLACNGVAHIINGVLLPPTAEFVV